MAQSDARQAALLSSDLVEQLPQLHKRPEMLPNLESASFARWRICQATRLLGVISSHGEKEFAVPLSTCNSGERKLEEARRQINSANRSALDAWAKIQLTYTRKDSGGFTIGK